MQCRWHSVWAFIIRCLKGNECLVSALSCYWSYKSDDKVGIATVVFGVLAILFNPIIPIYLHEKEIWTVIDIAAAVLLGIRYFTLRDRR